MKCEHIRELLSPYIDHMTDTKENMLIDAHLAECPECRQEYENLKLICTILGNIKHPEIPEQFTEDFHKRLLEEKTGYFTAKEFKRPKRSGWIAAGLAGIALTIGIYASSILPISSLIANLEEKPVDKERPKIAIEDIIKSIKGVENNEIIPEVDIAEIDKVTENLPPKVDNNVTSDITKPGDVIENYNPPLAVPRYVEDYATKVKVKDMGQATSQIIQIAEANNVEHKLMPNTTNAQALSATNTKEVNLKVDKNKAQNIIKQLNEIGQVSSPAQNRVEITNEYAHVEEQIFITENLIRKLETKNSLSEAETKELTELKAHLEQSNNKKAGLDKELNTVIVKVILVEEVKH